MAQLTYQRVVTGYHGCDVSLAKKVLAGAAQLKPSTNSYDWLGHGIYFWEHGPQRAYEWAIEQAGLGGPKVKSPSVLGAKINLGVCLDLLDTANTRLLRNWFQKFRARMRQHGIPLPQNRDAADHRLGDKVLRFRDCAVIDYTLASMMEKERIKYQSVRGVFVEGEPAFAGSKIALKSHIQIAVIDPVCVMEIFLPDPSDYRVQAES